MKLKVWDWNNRIKEIDLPPNKVIDHIFVHVLSGDETSIVVFKDGCSMHFDASEDRYTSYDDGSYVVSGNNVAKWIEWAPESDDVIGCAYDRQDYFFNMCMFK